MKTLFLSLAILLLMPYDVRSQLEGTVDQIAPFSEGLAAVRRGEQWGFIDTEGKLVIDFRSDLVWNREAGQQYGTVAQAPYPRFKNGRCLISKTLEEEEIPVYGFIDTNGAEVIPPEYLNLNEFEGPFTTGILLTKTFRGENNFGLRIYDYKYSEVVLDKQGEIQLLLAQRTNIHLQKRRYSLPALNSAVLNEKLIGVKSAAGNWELRKLAD